MEVTNCLTSMDQRSRSSFSVLRLLKVLVLATCAPITTLSQTVLFHETFDANAAGEYAFDTNTAFAAKSNGKAYWGVWDEVGDDDDFGGDAIPDTSKVPGFTSYDGNILIGRNMDVPQVGASPGSIVKEDISLLGAPEQLTISIRLAANNAGQQEFEEDDVMRVFVREGASTDWGAPIIDFQGSELLPLTLTLTEFTVDFNKPGESLDIKFEMYCDEGNERLAADDFKLIACPDQDGDGICDTDEIPGCDDPLADNYDSSATDNDGTCVYMPASFDGLVAEAYQLNSVEQGTHTFRVYAQFSNPNDQLISVFGTAASPLSVASSTSFYQDANGGPTSGGSNPLLFPGFPNLEWDSFVTIGSDDNNISGFQTAGLDFSSFEAGEALTSNATAGGSWFVFPDQEPQAFPSATGRVLIGQFTTDGTVTLNCNIQYRAADGTNPQAIGLTLVFPNNCPEDINGDGLVAVDDILTLLSSFGCTGSNCVGDLDGDDVVGVNDILTVLSAFSTSCF